MTATVVSVIVTILVIAAKWRIFDKMGVAGWKALIPIYSGYIIFDKIWSGKMYLATLAFTFGSMFASDMATQIGGNALLPLNLLALACGIVTLVLAVKFSAKLSKAFGHGNGFACGILFLNAIFMMILGFGKSSFKAA